MPKKYREFEVGDNVRVVDTPNVDCPFYWTNGMSGFLGEEVTISRKMFSSNEDTYLYEIKEDGGKWHWCGNCFEPLKPVPEINVDSFLSIIMGEVAANAKQVVSKPRRRRQSCATA